MLEVGIAINYTLQIPVQIPRFMQQYLTSPGTTFSDKCSDFSSKSYPSSVCTTFIYSHVLETNCKRSFVIKYKVQITVFLKFRLEFRPKIGSFNLDLNFTHPGSTAPGIYYLFRATLKITSGLCFVQCICVTLQACHETEKC